jgi:hypothetical protein
LLSDAFDDWNDQPNKAIQYSQVFNVNDMFVCSIDRKSLSCESLSVPFDRAAPCEPVFHQILVFDDLLLLVPAQSFHVHDLTFEICDCVATSCELCPQSLHFFPSEYSTAFSDS